jgi:hypothetical protein
MVYYKTIAQASFPNLHSFTAIQLIAPTMSHDRLITRFQAFKTVISETLPTVTFHHLGSDEYNVTLVKDRLVNYIVAAVELCHAIREFRTEAEGEIKLHTAIEERRLEEKASQALGGFVRAVKMQLVAIDAVVRMERHEGVVREAVEELLLLERTVEG